jgi:hypothetical protein
VRTGRLAYRDNDRISIIYYIKRWPSATTALKLKWFKSSQFDLTTKVTKSTKFRSKSIEPLRVPRAFVVNPAFSFLVAALPRYALCD